MTAPLSQLRIDATDIAGVVVQLNTVLERLQTQDQVRYNLEPARRPIRAVTADTVLAPGDSVLLCNCTGGAITVTLMPLASAQGRIFYIKKTDAGGNAVTLDGAGSETIDGSTTFATTAARESLTIVATPTEWYII